MEMRRAIGTALRLYPADYRTLFAGEILNAIEETAEERRGQGRPAFLRFVVAELMGLMTGAATEWIAKWTTDRSVRGSCLPDLRMMRPPGVLRELWFAGASMDVALPERHKIDHTENRSCS